MHRMTTQGQRTAAGYMNNQGIEPVHEWKRLVFDGISTDIFLAHEAHGIFRTIGERLGRLPKTVRSCLPEVVRR